MGFFIRKSFRAGPIRFNVSRGGIGVSGGVKGLRVGTGPRGAYVAGGRGGAYFRKSLRGSAGRDEASSQTPSVPHASIKPSTPKQAPIPAAVGLLLFISIVAGMSDILGDSPAVRIVAGVAFSGAVLLAIRHSRAQKTLSAFRTKLAELSSTPDSKLADEIASLIGRLSVATTSELIADAYERIVDSMVEEGISAEERIWLGEVEKALSLTPSAVASMRLNCYKKLVWELLADEELTPEEESLLAQIRSSLQIDDATLIEERDALEQTKRAGTPTLGLPTLDVDMKLQRGEVCHHQTAGALMEMKVLRTYTVDGKREKEEDLVESKRGDIYITSKRLLVVGDGTSAIPHEKILDLEVDWDRKVVIITKDGRQKPIYLSVPDAIYTGKLLEHLSGIVEA